MSEKIEVGNVSASRGELKKGIIKGIELNNNTRIDIPVLVLNGAFEGPTLLMVSTQHGIEIQGIEVIQKVIREKIDPTKLRGAIIGIPVENPLAYMHYQYLSWIDNLDLGGGGSGSLLTADRPNGNSTERLAYALWKEAWSKADLVINIHCNTRPDSLIWQGINIGNPKTKEALIKMAKSFGITTMWSDTPLNEDAPPTLGNLAGKKGVPVLLIELIDGRWISEPSTTAGVKGVLNTMKTFNMIEGAIEPQGGFTIIEGKCRGYGPIRANKGGLIRFFKKPGELINKDEVFAEIFDLYGDVIEKIRMPVDGYTWAYSCGESLGTSGALQCVQTGANVAYVFTRDKD
ncbi:MAG: succinylglutamate desuccinylase/aspartoacylase family protein [Candidatus Bathyarchaeia archaeon]|jgi:predicted deacylase